MTKHPYDHKKHDKRRDWPDGGSIYMRRCLECGYVFFGYKRRVVCKLCTKAKP